MNKNTFSGNEIEVGGAGESEGVLSLTGIVDKLCPRIIVFFDKKIFRKVPSFIFA